MKKVSKVLLLIGQILMIVDIVSVFIASVIMFLCATPIALNPIRDAIIASDSTISGTAVDAMMYYIQISFIFTGASMLISIVPMIIAATFASKARKEETEVSIVVTMVFAFLTGSYVMLAGGILGLIAYLKQNR